MNNLHNNSNKKNITLEQFAKETTDRLKAIGISKINRKHIEKAYLKYLTVSDTVSTLL